MIRGQQSYPHVGDGNRLIAIIRHHKKNRQQSRGREVGGKTAQETRFYLTSLVLLAHLLGLVVRSHWSVENSLHWGLDMVFRDDECRVRTDHAPANFATIRHMAQNLIRKAPGKTSVRLKRKAAGWDDDFLAELIGR